MRRSLIVGGAAVALGLIGMAVAWHGRSAAPPDIGGPFTLTDGAGHTVTDRDYAGDWRLVYFGYTHCPDACPTTLGDLGAALDKLSPAARAHTRVLFVTVDPERDTPHVMGDYVHAFGPEFVGLTGTPAQLAHMQTAYHVYARRRELAGGDYAMDHSSIVYVMRPDGGFAGLLDDGMPPGEMAKQVKGYEGLLF